MAENLFEENFEDAEDEGQILEVGQKEREEANKIKSKFSYLCRPSVDPSFNESTDFIFMQTDVDYYIGKGILKFLKPASLILTRNLRVIATCHY